VDGTGGELEEGQEDRLRTDLLDLALLWSDLTVRSAPAEDVNRARRVALQVLAEAEQLGGPNPILNRQRQDYEEALGERETAAPARSAADVAPQTAWEHYAQGRYYLRREAFAEAAAAFERAIELRPHDWWPHYYRGLCAFRLGRYADAAQAYDTCVALGPPRAECYHNRALAHAALGQLEKALKDYDQALAIDPTFAPAVLNRGMAYYQLHRFAEAGADLERALKLNAEPAVCYYNMALIQQARGDLEAAREWRRRLQELAHPLAHELSERLGSGF
jgi:tetratricopeptide (TPR) repeat protein